jgi:urease accessory protein
MDRDAAAVRQGRPVIFSSLREDPQASAVTAWVRDALAEHSGAAVAEALAEDEAETIAEAETGAGRS